MGLVSNTRALAYSLQARNGHGLIPCLASTIFEEAILNLDSCGIQNGPSKAYLAVKISWRGFHASARLRGTNKIEMQKQFEGPSLSFG